MANNDYFLTIESDDTFDVSTLSACSDLVAVEFSIRAANGETFIVETANGIEVVAASGLIADRYTVTRMDVDGEPIDVPRSATGAWVVLGVNRPEVSDVNEFEVGGVKGWSWATVSGDVFTAVPED